jgi:hypothetical protein
VAIKELKVRFPLYARALEFCAAHQDSFVRTTAMNICLNTLRLATVQPKAGESDDAGIDVDMGSSPDGVLHNSKALPFRERLAIAQHVCAPSRVERLVSPIFTKLAHLWSVLEEQFREVGNPGTPGGQPSANLKVAKAKDMARRQKMTDAFQDLAASLQDELELLEDVLKVGLTSLNEQAIEMMLATFVYPLLLQPLLLYFQRTEIPDKVLYSDPLNDHSAGRGMKSGYPLVVGDSSFISAPAKSAFFSLAAVFYFITNQPLLRLLFGALFHPLAPDAAGEIVIRAKADVACIGPDGNTTIRVDPLNAEGKIESPTDRSTYLFGTVTGEKYKSSHGYSDTIDDVETCVFVLSPALAEILESKGDDLGLIARTRHNPYRKAIFKCFTLSHEFDLRPLAVVAVDAAVNAFEDKFVADMLLGLDLKRFKDNMPIDERKLDSKLARDIDDRDMGGPVSNESRLSLGGTPAGGKVGFDFSNEILSSFRSCVMNATPAGNGECPVGTACGKCLFVLLT